MSTDEADHDIPASSIDPLNGALLAWHAMKEGGLEPTIISHDDYWALSAEEQQGDVFLVLQRDTYKVWRDRFG